jgi:hypothetical protein
MLAQVVAVGTAQEATEPSLRELTEQNKKLQQRVDEQQRQIDELRARLDGLPKTPPPAPPPRPEPETEPVKSPLSSAGDSGRSLRISGEAGLAFFSGAEDSAFPNSEFRVDDAANSTWISSGPSSSDRMPRSVSARAACIFRSARNTRCAA